MSAAICDNGHQRPAIFAAFSVTTSTLLGNGIHPRAFLLMDILMRPFSSSFLSVPPIADCFSHDINDLFHPCPIV